ncbi:MAG: hypothetical protein VX737_03895, partial [Pseudomonadota bacterium]|nr:hypothetical protein [Pseudomonadota bacterium]
TLLYIASAACEGHPESLNAISTKLENFTKEELKAIFQASPGILNNIVYAACEGHSDALHAILAHLDGVMDLENQEVREYYEYLNNKIKHYLFLKPNRFLGLERAFRDLGTAAFARITTGVPFKIILEKSINWYKEFTAIFNENASDQADRSGTEFQIQENLSARVRRFINDNVLQRDRDQRSREYRVNFVKGLCDYLTMMGYHHFVLDLNKIYLTYQSGLNGFNTPGYADSVLGELYRNLAGPSGTYFFQASQRDQRYKKAYGMLKSFNENLGLWIQFKPGRDPLSAQSTVVEHFKLFLRSYLNTLGDIGIDNSLDYDDVNCILKEKDWDAFLDCRNRFLVNESEDVAASSGSFQPFSRGS